MLIIDAHQDIAFNALAYGRDYRQFAWQARRAEYGRGYPMATLGFPDARLGRVGIVFATIYVAPEFAANRMPELQAVSYKDTKGAYRQALRQMDYYHRLADEVDALCIIQTQKDLDNVLASWEEGTSISDHKQGLVILMEGADPVIEPKQFEEWHERGVRIVGPAWMETRYSAGTGAAGTLSFAGYDLLDEMMDKRVILDLSHMAEQAYFQALDRYDGPVIASHSNPRRFCDTDRHLSDVMIRRLAERDGVMGVVLFNQFLNPLWDPGRSPTRVTLQDVVDVIDHVCQLTGNALHVGIGSDFDGGFGAESTPDGLDTVGDLWLLDGALRQRGYDDDAIRAILSGNMLRKLRQAL